MGQDCRMLEVDKVQASRCLARGSSSKKAGPASIEMQRSHM